MLQSDELEKKVFLLKLLLKESDESMEDVVNALVNTGMFDKEAALQHLKELEERGYVKDGALTMLGTAEAQKAKQEFTLES
jgi:predicted ArsR family transcriptional regulator